MKKRYLILFVSLVLLIIIIFFYNKTSFKVIDKNMSNDNYNYNIIYPVFSNEKIDNYIDKYLDEVVLEIKYNYNNKKSLFVDYDYTIEDNNIDITFYKYLTDNNVLNYDIYNIKYNIEQEIIISNKIENNNANYYDFVNNRKIDIDKPMIAFTFDDGPSYNTNKIINHLTNYNSTATFFLVGNKVNKYIKTLDKLVNSNMDIGNHTYSHKLLTNLKEERIKEEITKTNDIIYSITNIRPTFFRPSYGSVNKKIKKISNMPIVIWNLDTLDWKYHNSKKIMNKILKYATDGDIILMHDTYSATAKAVELVLPELIKKGFQIVSVKELFYYKGITPKLGYAYGFVN